MLTCGLKIATGHTGRSARPLPYDHSPADDERHEHRPKAGARTPSEGKTASALLHEYDQAA